MSYQDYSTDSSSGKLLVFFFISSAVYIILLYNISLLHCIVFISIDTEYEYSSDSGYSADGSVSSQVVNVGVFLPIFQLVPIHCATLCPSIPANSFHQQVPGSAANHRLIKWSLPPPPVSPVSLPGWKPMP